MGLFARPFSAVIIECTSLFLSYLFPVDKSEKNFDVTQQSASEDDDALNLTAELSDISDAEDSAKVVLPKNCVQRLLTPEQRHESDFENYSNESKAVPSSSGAGTGQDACRTKNSSRSSCSDIEASRDQSRDEKPSVVSPQPRPKIWSISEIISPKNEICKTQVS